MKMHLVFLVNLTFLTALMLESCSSSDVDKRYAPYQFNQSELDSLVGLKLAIVDEAKRPDGSVQERRFYLGDSVKYVLTFNKSKNLLHVSKYEEAHEVWTENYFPNGQRLSRFTMFTDSETGESYYEGPYQSYYQTGWLKEDGFYKKNKPFWMLPYTENGLSSDTIFYEYQESGNSQIEPVNIL